MQLTLRHLDELAHIRAKLLLKSVEINEAIAIGVKDSLHEEAHICLAGFNLVLSEIGLKVLVRDVTISVDVEGSEDLKRLWLLATSE